MLISKPRCRIKVCGITSVDDALSVCEAGVDAMGLVFYARSPRNVSIEQAAEICWHLPPFVSSVGLFLDAEEAFVDAVLQRVPLNMLQFHGSEALTYCEQFNRPYLKGIGMRGLEPKVGLDAYIKAYPSASGFLVDSHAPGAAGGTGQTFDWASIPQDFPRPLILAGGLTPDNVERAIQQTQVYGVDVSSGVEAKPGVKDPAKVLAFVAAVQTAAAV